MGSQLCHALLEAYVGKLGLGLWGLVFEKPMLNPFLLLRCAIPYVLLVCVQLGHMASF